METTPTAGPALKVAAGLVGLAFAAFLAHTALNLGGPGVDWLFNDFVYNFLELSAAVACLTRAAVVRSERLPWLIMGVGLLSYAAGDIYWALFLSDLESPPYPSIGDGLYLLFYPTSYVTLVMLIRRRVPSFRRSLWLDGAIAGLAIAAVAAALAFQPIIDTTEGSAATVATTLAYPIGDVTLLALVAVVFGLSGWRPGRAWLMIGAGLALGGVGDVIYLVQAAEGTYVEGTMLDAVWPASVLLIGLSAWQPAHMHPDAYLGGWRAVVVPVWFAMVAVGLLTYDHYIRLNTAALILTVATLAVALLRMALAFLENQALLRASRREASTDALTGLNNRRKLMADLNREIARSTNSHDLTVLLFDLDGFKSYNDSFGHPAGDALLSRLGRRLGAAVEPYGAAYRLGGDEFCALVRPDGVGVDSILAATVVSLSERGEGFDVGTSYGAAAVPGEADEPAEALQLADRRMYAQKGGRRSSPARQSRDVLLRTLRERQPDLHKHLTDVAELALTVGRRFDMTPDELDVLARAAELHDVGKIAIPDAILNKPGPLDEAEWAFMRRHTIIGERILMAAPALKPVAKVVRSSHERWDGDGYPDGLAGEEIPLGARIVAVCDAFNAMTSDRPYRCSLTPREAFKELDRCAGSQFDGAVVDAFHREMDVPSSTPEPVADRS